MKVLSKIKELNWNPALDRRVRIFGFIVFILIIYMYFNRPINNLIFYIVLIFYFFWGLGAILLPQRFRILFDIKGKERKPRFVDD